MEEIQGLFGKWALILVLQEVRPKVCGRPDTHAVLRIGMKGKCESGPSGPLDFSGRSGASLPWGLPWIFRGASVRLFSGWSLNAAFCVLLLGKSPLELPPSSPHSDWGQWSRRGTLSLSLMGGDMQAVVPAVDLSPLKLHARRPGELAG